MLLEEEVNYLSSISANFFFSFWWFLLSTNLTRNKWYKQNINAIEKDTSSSERVKIHKQGIFNLFTLYLEDFSTRKIHSRCQCQSASNLPSSEIPSNGSRGPLITLSSGIRNGAISRLMERLTLSFSLSLEWPRAYCACNGRVKKVKRNFPYLILPASPFLLRSPPSPFLRPKWREREPWTNCLQRRQVLLSPYCFPWDWSARKTNPPWN